MRPEGPGSPLIRQLESVGWASPTGSDAMVPSYPSASRSGLDSIEDSSLWFRGRNDIAAAALSRWRLPQTLVEVGSGNGTVAYHLQQAGFDVIAVEPSEEGTAHALRRGVDHAFCNTLEGMAFPDASLPAVGAFDVIEHLQEPASLVREVSRVLQPGGWFVVTVPALSALWSQADELAGHFRRYRIRSLDRLMAGAGFERRAATYFFSFGVPKVLMARVLPYRLGQRLTEGELRALALKELAPDGVAATLAGNLAAAERRLIARGIRIPVGSSLLGLLCPGRNAGCPGRLAGVRWTQSAVRSMVLGPDPRSLSPSSAARGGAPICRERWTARLGRRRCPGTDCPPRP